MGEVPEAVVNEVDCHEDHTDSRGEEKERVVRFQGRADDALGGGQESVKVGRADSGKDDAEAQKQKIYVLLH